MKTQALQTWQIYGIGGLACAAVTFCAWNFIAGPALARHQHGRDLKIEMLDRHRQLPKLSAQLTVTRRQATAVHEMVEQTHVALQPTTALNQRLAQIESLAGGCGVSLDEVRPGDGIACSHYQSVPIRLSGSAAYPACAEFLQRLHATFPDVGVKSMDLAAANSAKTSGATFRVELIWYAKSS
ncbi:MAG TPA: type 4a pilus biogenesis protein PilO [Tepidisphaeraceae bacterium]|nr:type 4a pilus biogenesis protein PilO [Tepidisphaeraceae bacterium]